MCEEEQIFRCKCGFETDDLWSLEEHLDVDHFDHQLIDRIGRVWNSDEAVALVTPNPREWLQAMRSKNPEAVA